MNFFQSIFADDPDPPEPESGPKQPEPTSPQDQPEPDPDPSAPAGPWGFGGLIKTLTVKSESVLETYRRDLKEFGSGLKKEIEVAQGSLGSVGHAIDEIGSSVIKGTAQIISQGKEALLTASPDNPESDSDGSHLDRAQSGGLTSKRYNRFDAQVRAVQGDPATYAEDPEDKEEFGRWKLGFELEGKREEMSKLLEENGEMGSVYRRLVPGVVDEEGFWCRYYYKVYKLRLAEDVRAKIVRRAISSDEEELSWDVDDDEEEEGEEVAAGKKSDGVEGNAGSGREGLVEAVKEDVKADLQRDGDEKIEQDGHAKELKEEMGDGRNLDEGMKAEKMVGGGESGPEKVVVDESKGANGMKDEQKVGPSESSKGMSSQEEEDLGWDEIEDLSGIDEKKVSHSGSPNKADLMRRLSTAEEEDLSWDIEDDDDNDNDNVQVKA